MTFRSTSRRLVAAALTSAAAVALTAGPTAGTASAQPLSSAKEQSTASATCLVPNPLPFGPDCIVPDPPASPPPSQPPMSEVKTPPPPPQVDPPQYTPLHHMREVHHSGTTPPATPPEAQPTQQPAATPPAVPPAAQPTQQPSATSNNLVGADKTGVEDTVVVDATGVADAGVDNAGNADVGIDNGAGDFTGDAGAMDGGIQ